MFYLMLLNALNVLEVLYPIFKPHVDLLENHVSQIQERHP